MKESILDINFWLRQNVIPLFLRMDDIEEFEEEIEDILKKPINFEFRNFSELFETIYDCFKHKKRFKLLTGKTFKEFESLLKRYKDEINFHIDNSKLDKRFKFALERINKLNRIVFDLEANKQSYQDLIFISLSDKMINFYREKYFEL